jgi:hypothetical protein
METLMHERPEDDRPLMTRKAAVEHINKKLGIPLKLSSFAKKAMRGETLTPDGYYGKTELYKPARVESWALDTLCTAKPAKLNAA